MSENKEPHFFSREKKFRKGVDFHNNLFSTDSDHKVFGESSTGYMISEESISRISRCLSRPKIIMVLREPVERAFSHYRWRFRLGLEKSSFLRAMRESGYGYDPEKPDRWGYASYLQFSKYSTYVPLWYNEFSKDNVLLIDSSRLKFDMNLVLKSCFDFLDAEEIEVKESIFLNTTESTIAHPARSMEFAEKLIPETLKSTQMYASLKRGILLPFTQQPPAEMTSDERAFAESELAEDIAFYRAAFGK